MTIIKRKREQIIIYIIGKYGTTKHLHFLITYTRYNPRYLRKSFGLADGKWIERCWAVLKSYIPVTRHMSAEHRQLTLTMALLYFKNRRNKTIGIHTFHDSS